MLGQTKTNLDDDLFDDSAGYEDETGIQLNPNLSPEEKKRAVILARLFSMDTSNVLCGLCLVKGVPGAGKDVLGNYLSFSCGRFYPQKSIMRDEKPRRLFGHYDGLFNPAVLKDELSKMSEIAKGMGLKSYDGALEKAADAWVTETGRVMLKDSVLYLTEFWKYVYKREPHNAMNKAMGGIHKEKRHINTLIIGTVQQLEDLDNYTCMPFVDWTVTCTHSTRNPTGFVYFVQKVKWDYNQKMLVSIGSPFPIAFDAGSPRRFIGDGKIQLLKPQYQSETEEERIVLDVLKAGADTYEELVQVITTYGDMSKDEILATLKELKFRKHKRVIFYPDYFSIFNSKSAPNQNTRIKVED